MSRLDRTGSWLLDRFNVAALRGARKSLLQGLLLRPDDLASMWPRSEERGNCCATAQAPSLFCFNVAALRGARKLILSSSSFSFVFASMWPRSEERGNAGQPQVEISVGGLQCGRAPRSAEISRAPILPWPRPSGFNVAALRGARKLEENGDGNLAGSASMWPRSEERGNDQAYLAAVAKLEKLQCGRAPRSAEYGALRLPGSSGIGFNVAALRGARK